MALQCDIAPVSKFDRKHYFYPDLPKGYQISQYDQPIAAHGQMMVDLSLEDSTVPSAKVAIRRVHLEEDTAKLSHTEGALLVDFNRAGIPLAEIVTEPDIKTALQAKVFCQELQILLRALGVSDADMEKGHMRCEANISVQHEGSFAIVDGEVVATGTHPLSPKTELKNLNSFRAIERGIAYEIERQSTAITEGKPLQQETRGWNEKEEVTYSMRQKEEAKEYRYFPDPDIPPFEPLHVAGTISLPELPGAQRRRFMDEYGFSPSDAKLLTTDPVVADFVEQTISELVSWLSSTLLAETRRADELFETEKKTLARLLGSFTTTKLFAILSEAKRSIHETHLTPENYAELLSYIYTKKVGTQNAHKTLIIMANSEAEKDPSHIIDEKGWWQTTNTEEIDRLVENIIQSYPEQVAAYRGGKTTILKFLLGMLMRESGGTIDPSEAEKKLLEKL